MPRSYLDRAKKLKPLVRTLAKTTDLPVSEISRQTGLPYETTRQWVLRYRTPPQRLPYGKAVGHRHFNEYLRKAGIAPADRMRLIEERRHAA